MMIIFSIISAFLASAAVGKECPIGNSCVPSGDCPQYIADGERLDTLQSDDYFDLLTELESRVCSEEGEQERVCCHSDTLEVNSGNRVDPNYARVNLPWMTHLVFDGTIFCGGAVVHDRFILTAKHCVQECPCFKGDYRNCTDTCKVKLREYDSFAISTETLHTIEDIFMPGSLGSVKLPTTARRLFDLALIKLDKSVNHCHDEDPTKCWKIKPIEMANNDTRINRKTKLRALGWGAYDATGEQSQYLRQVDLTLNKSDTGCECDNFYSLQTNVGPDGQDTCAGDSGGPLVTEVDGTYTLVGVLQGGGVDCSQLDVEDYAPDSPGTWMRVAAFRDWIEQKILSETRDVNGRWGTWSSWTRCLNPCSGTKTRVRVCLAPKNNGADCPWIHDADNENESQSEPCHDENHCQAQVSVPEPSKPVSGPNYLTVTSPGQAGEEHYWLMGVYHQTQYLHNNKPVWARHEGTWKLFYSNTGRWMIGEDPATDLGYVGTAGGSQQGWPDEATGWQHLANCKIWHNLANCQTWQTDDLLTVTEGLTDYPASIKTIDLSGGKSHLVGVYRRQGHSLVWKYKDYELSRKGKLWCITGDNGQCIPVTGWDYAEDHIWPDTDTLFIWDFPEYITITSSGPAAEKKRWLMGRYKLETDKSASLKPVYKKTDDDEAFIYYNGLGYWMVSSDINKNSGWLKCDKGGLQTVPTTGWEYSYGGFLPDPYLRINYN